MGLPRIDTSYFVVVHAEDPDVTPLSPDAAGWISVSSASCDPGATRLRVRALTGMEVLAVPRSEKREDLRAWLSGLAAAGVHPDDSDLLTSLPWQYGLGVGTVVLDASTAPPDPTSAPSSDG